MNRRTFLHQAALAVAGLGIDPERLLWEPKKTIFIPPARRVYMLTDISIAGQAHRLSEAIPISEDDLATFELFMKANLIDELMKAVSIKAVGGYA